MNALRLETLLFASLVLLLTGCGTNDTKLGNGGGGPGGGIGGGGGDKTVSGLVVDNQGQPLQNRTVLIGTGSATTDASGQFSITGVAIPYDLVIIEPASEKVATMYTGLTRLDPKVLDLGVNNPTNRSATVGGNIVGGDPLPTPSGTLSAVSWGSIEAATYEIETSTPYALEVPWSGPTTIAGAVHGLQWTIDTNGTVTGYHSHGVNNGVSLTASGTVTNADLQLTATLTDNISTNISAPAGHEIFERDVFLTFDDGAAFLVSQDGLDAGSFQFPVPSGVGAKAVVTVYAVNGDGSSQTAAQATDSAPGTAGATLMLPAPAVATAPAQGATGVDTSTDLVWTPVAGGIHLLLLTGAGNDPAFAIVSGGTHVRIPDLSAQGLALPSNRPYDFVLIGIGPLASVDAFAATGTFNGLTFQTGSASGFTTK